MVSKFKIELNNMKSVLFDKIALSDEYLDMKLGVDGEIIHAHRAILASASPYFENLLSAYKDEENLISKYSV